MFGYIRCMIFKYYVNKEIGERIFECVPLIVYDNVKQLYKNHKSLTALYNQGSHFYVELSSRTGERTINKERI